MATGGNHTRTHVVPVGGGESSDQTDASAADFTALIHQEAITTLHEQEVDELHRQHAFHEEALRRRQSKLQSKSKRKTEMRLVARTKVRKSKVLRQLPLFSGMSESDLEAVLDATKFERFSEGTVICSQGDLALKFYIVVNGTCRVSVKQPALPGSDSTTASGVGRGAAEHVAVFWRGLLRAGDRGPAKNGDRDGVHRVGRAAAVPPPRRFGAAGRAGGHPLRRDLGAAAGGEGAVAGERSQPDGNGGRTRRRQLINLILIQTKKLQIRRTDDIDQQYCFDSLSGSGESSHTVLYSIVLNSTKTPACT